MELRVYSAAEVHDALPWAALVDALEAAFVAGRTEAPVRHVHRLSPDGTLLLMPAWSDRALGVKLVTVMQGAAAQGASTVAASYLLLDRDTGAPRALIDGEALTLRRTAATSALAARHLAPADAASLLVVGAGRLAPWMARAHVALRPALRRVRIWARRHDAAAACAAQLRAEAIDATAVEDLEAAVRAGGIVCCATTSAAPIVRGEWLAPGTHLDLVGGFRRDMREADDAAVRRAHVVVDTYAGALAEAGDLTQPLAAGLITRDHVAAELAELLRGERGARPRSDAVTLFKSVGTALEDLAAAQLALRNA
ncbi:MAG: ornithine cyclodeaminase family protein [Aquincola sp.]|nr:ornithine cyclodeaminase family protein [Aquincola sp.]MDH4287319.1 ornithine cyclodeaminase family protein [Aquincola sp.]MDH5328348.1 ornithine cyclodeaminase family protein [Aquincola sp.]